MTFTTYWLASYLLVGWSFSKWLQQRARGGRKYTALDLAYQTVLLFLVAGILSPLVLLVEVDNLLRRK